MNTLKTFVARFALACAALSAAAAFSQDARACGDVFIPEIDHRILTPNLEREDWGWMGFGFTHEHRPNNWNPWINSNWLACCATKSGC